jgi:hypothetical protein
MRQWHTGALKAAASCRGQARHGCRRQGSYAGSFETPSQRIGHGPAYCSVRRKWMLFWGTKKKIVENKSRGPPALQLFKVSVISHCVFLKWNNCERAPFRNARNQDALGPRPGPCHTIAARPCGPGLTVRGRDEPHDRDTSEVLTAILSLLACRRSARSLRPPLLLDLILLPVLVAILQADRPASAGRRSASLRLTPASSIAFAATSSPFLSFSHFG